MRKNIAYTLVLFIPIAVNAQILRVKSDVTLPTSHYTAPLDTLYPPSFSMPCFTNDQTPIVYYGIDYYLPIDSGYVFGNNAYGDLESAQKYTYSGTASMVGVLAYFGAVTNNHNSNTHVTVYSENTTTKAPDAVIANSNNVAVGNISLVNFTYYPFSSPVNISNSTFVVSLVFPTTIGDEVGLTSTEDPCNSNDSLSWIKDFNGNWYSTNHYWGGFNVDITLLPVLDLATGSKDITSSNELQLFPVFPNPTNNNIIIAFQSKITEDVTIAVFDLSGKEVKTEIFENCMKGKNHKQLNCDDLPSGEYIYILQQGKNRIAGRFIKQ